MKILTFYAEGGVDMDLFLWIILIAIAILVIFLIVRSGKSGRRVIDDSGPEFGRLDRALQKDTIHRETGEFTIAIDLGEVEMMIRNEDYDLAEDKVKEYIAEAERMGDTSSIANLMGYLEKIKIARKRRF